jgi:hypothetical protein
MSGMEDGWGFMRSARRRILEMLLAFEHWRERRRAVPRPFAGFIGDSRPRRDDGPEGDDLLGDGVPRRPAPMAGSAAVALAEDDAEERSAASTR